MDAFEFTRIVAAVIVGNALTFIVAYLVWRANKVEKIGLPASTLPGWLYLLALIPFAVVFAAAASLN